MKRRVPTYFRRRLLAGMITLAVLGSDVAIVKAATSNESRLGPVTDERTGWSPPSPDLGTPFS